MRPVERQRIVSVICLELDIDSDVYPELYAKLVALSAPGARCERVRQLAASGLVWETLRIEGHAPPIGRRPAGTQAPAKSAVQPRAPSEPAASRAARATSPKAGFVDLAINAPPMPHSLHRAAAGDLGSNHKAVGAELPVLTDVLEPAVRAPISEGAEGMDDTTPADEVRHTQPLWPHGTKPPPATRSRLMRMKERGLFKNG
ncbi:MAG: hypothetical protein JF606_07740 [Burkholderiales bacterium]|nr:hypothetical protein [Burkholderiales bacterium]